MASQSDPGPFDLSDKLAVVTGVTRGIGKAMAEALAAAGADIIGASSSIRASDSQVQRHVEARGRSFTPYRVDLNRREEVKAFAATLVATDRDRPVDILVNNAGIIRRAPAIDHPDEAWDQVLAVNLSAPFLLTREVGRSMVRRGRGKIIFTVSLLSFQGGVLVPSYTASKAGLAGLAKAFANEWASSGVNVNAIAPGYIATQNTQPLRDDPDRRQSILDRIPAGRWGEPDDVAGATVFLASPASDYVNGVTLPVDGGWLAR